MPKGIKVAIIVLLSIIIVLSATVCTYFFFPWHRGFFNHADEEFAIPGLDTDFVPQGFTELKGYNKYVISGYMNDGSPSRFYVIDQETKAVDKYITLKIQDTKMYNGHAGGVASYGSLLWTVSYAEDLDKGIVFCFDVSRVLAADNGEVVPIRDFFDPLNNADCVFVQDDMLWIGEFYRENSHETDEDHHKKTRTGDKHHALAYGYKISEKYNTGVINEECPDKLLSIRDLCQGIDVTSDGKFVLSTSYSIPNSHLYYYNNVLEEEPHATARVGLSEVPMWYLDDNALINSVEIPSMAEEIVIKNGRVYILFESACKKYRLVNRTRLKSVYSIPLSYLEK